MYIYCGVWCHFNYAKKLITEFLGQAARTAKTPLEKGADMSAMKKGEETLNQEKHPYRRALGQILYLATTTRPDLSNSARELATVSSAPTIRHWRSLQHVLRYIYTNLEYGLYFPKSQLTTYNLKGYSDADFAGNEDTRKSCTGYIIKLGGGIVDWVSLTQRTVATFTTEAEWNALYEGVRHGEFIRSFLQELGFKSDKVHWYYGNIATVTAATSPGHVERTRYLDVKLKRTRELILQENIPINYIPASEQEADGLTKRLGGANHLCFINYVVSKIIKEDKNGIESKCVSSG